MSPEDLPDNVLLGKWTGTVLTQQPNQRDPVSRIVHLTFSEKTATSDIPFEGWENMAVTYDVRPQDVFVTSFGAASSDRAPYDFRISDINRVKIHFGEYGDVTLERVGKPIYTPPPTNLVAP